MAEYYVLSERCQNPTVPQGCLNELEDVLIETLDARLLTRQPRRMGRLVRLLVGKANRVIPALAREGVVDAPRRRGSSERVLIVVCFGLPELVLDLRSVANWRTEFDLVCAYVFDAFPPRLVRRFADWRLSVCQDTLNAVDRLFVPMPESRRALAEMLKTPTSVVPLACDTVRFASNLPERSIDVMGYGRQDPRHSQVLAAAYNDAKTSRLFFQTGHLMGSHTSDHTAQRQLFWKLLSRSQISLAYDPRQLDPDRRIPWSFVGQRWFEGITAGCAVVGRRPTCSSADELLHWEDSTIEIPDDPREIVGFLEALLADRTRLRAVQKRNYSHAIMDHDWRYRIGNMLDELGHPHPPKLSAALGHLDRQTAGLAADL